MSIIREFTLYLHAGITTPEVIHANQYSQGETWIFKLLQDDGSVYVPSTGALIGVKADGHAIAGLTGTVLGDGRVSITTTQQLTAAAGDAICELTIDGGSNGSANFVIRVEKKPTDDAILSESDLSIIQEGLNSVTPAAIEEKVSDWLEENFTEPPVDPTLSISNAAADAKVTGDKLTELKTNLNDISYSPNLFDSATITSGYRLSNAGIPYVDADCFLSAFIPVEVGRTYTKNSPTTDAYHRFGLFDSDKVFVRALDTSNSVMIEEGVSYLRFCGYLTELSTTELTGGISLIPVTSAEIENGAVTQEKLSFSELVMPSNLFNYADSDAYKEGYWYYSTAIGSTVAAVSNQYTTNYKAIKARTYNAEKITIGIHGYIGTQPVVYWIGAVDADMKLLGYVTAQTAMPYTYTLPEGTVYYLASVRDMAADYAQKLMVVNGETLPQEYSKYDTPYYLLNNCRVDYAELGAFASIVGTEENAVKVTAPDAYYLTVGDTFQLFYKGIINAVHPEMYDIVATCSKGNAFERFYQITPTTAETLTLNISVYGINHNLLDSKNVSLIVRGVASSPSAQKNVLCVGDSLTVGGEWPKELYRRLTGTGGTPAADGLSNINFIGSKVSNGVHYEGVGGYTFTNYNTESVSASVKNITTAHDKTQDDQHSIYKASNNSTWKLETIENNKIKIILVSGTASTFPATGTLTWVSGGVNHSNIVYTASENAAGNPFWNENTSAVDFANYATEHGVSSIDFVYILLGWNSVNTTETVYKNSVMTFINNVHASFTNAKIILMGLELPARDGLAVNYGSTGSYSKYYNLMQFVWNIDKWYSDIADENTNVYSMNISGQFDTEYNMQTGTRQVNTRNSETETYQTNGIHPANSGYMQIADAVYRDIMGRL